MVPCCFHLQPAMSAQIFLEQGRSDTCPCFVCCASKVAEGGLGSFSFPGGVLLEGQGRPLSFVYSVCLPFCLSVFQPSPASKFIQGYLGAVISAVSIAVSSSYPAPKGCCQGVGNGVCEGMSSHFFREEALIGRTQIGTLGHWGR